MITKVTFEDAIKVEDILFQKMYEVTNETTGRKVCIILDENCVRWMGYAKGIEAHYMTTAKKCRQYSYGWVPVNGRHEFKNDNRAKCIANALRFVNESARSYVK